MIILLHTVSSMCSRPLPCTILSTGQFRKRAGGESISSGGAAQVIVSTRSNFADGTTCGVLAGSLDRPERIACEGDPPFQLPSTLYHFVFLPSMSSAHNLCTQAALLGSS